MCCCSIFFCLIQSFPYISISLLPTVGLIYGYDAIIKGCFVFLLYIFLSGCLSRLNIRSEPISFLSNVILIGVLFCFPVQLIPDSSVALFDALLKLAMPAWFLTEAISIYHIADAFSSRMLSWLEDSSQDEWMKMVIVMLMTVLGIISIYVLYGVLLTEYWWLCGLFVPLFAFSVYQTYKDKNGNMLMASMVILSSALLLEMMINEISSYKEVHIKITDAQGSDMNEYSFLKIIRVLLTNYSEYFSLSIDVWKQALNVTTLVKIFFRVFFLISVYLRVEQEEPDESHRNALMSPYSMLIQLVIVPEIYQLLCQSFPPTIPSKLHRYNHGDAVLVYMVLQSFSIQLLYLFSLLKHEN